MNQKVSFYYEFASTYSYLSVLRIEALAQKANIEIEWKPFLLGPIFKNQGLQDSPFNIYKQKGQYMWRDIERICQSRGFPFKKPSAFPQNGLLAARIALIGANEGWCSEFSKQIFTANFASDQNISDDLVLSSILDSLGLDSKGILKKANSEENKRALRTQTKEAENLGIFGAPSFIVHQAQNHEPIRHELFWGDDRLEQALAFAKR